MENNRLIIPEYPLLVLPSLAKEIGLNEAIFLQQLHFWLVKSEHSHEGEKWAYNSFSEWEIQFPFWSIATIRKILTNLEKKGIIVFKDLNDLTNHAKGSNWYSINYDKISSSNLL